MNLLDICKKNHENDAGFCRHYMFLYSLILGMESQNVLEFGSGFSTKCIIEALKLTGGQLTSIEQRNLETQKAFFDQEFISSNSSRWTFVHGDSLSVVPTLPHPAYDVVLHDGSHTGSVVALDINNILPHIKKNGILLIHDTAHSDLGEEMREGIHSSNLSHLKHEICTLPYGYGLTLVKLLESHTTQEVDIKWRKG